MEEKINKKMDKKKIILFVVITYAIAWIFMIPTSLYYRGHQDATGTMVFRIGAMAGMFAPLLGALIVNKGLRGMGWVPKIKGNVKWIFWAILVAAVSIVGGAALFYAIFPDLFDTTGSYIISTGKSAGIDIVAELESKGLSLSTYFIIQAIAAFTYGPLINVFFTIGEEAGWRGFLYPELRKGFGRIPAWIIGGSIWSVFHFPLIVIAGYEYGFDYIGAPLLGLLVFTLSCIIMGLLHEIIYDKTKCIWFPAFLHGVINAAAGLALFFWNVNSDGKAEKYMIFGPASNGIIGMIPMAIIAVIMAVIVIKGNKSKSGQ